MIIKKENIKWMPAITPQECDWLVVDGNKFWAITNWYSFDDFGCTLETVTAERDGEEIEVYSFDEGQSWTYDIEEA